MMTLCVNVSSQCLSHRNDYSVDEKPHGTDYVRTSHRHSSAASSSAAATVAGLYERFARHRAAWRLFLFRETSTSVRRTSEMRPREMLIVRHRKCFSPIWLPYVSIDQELAVSPNALFFTKLLAHRRQRFERCGVLLVDANSRDGGEVKPARRCNVSP